MMTAVRSNSSQRLSPSNNIVEKKPDDPSLPSADATMGESTGGNIENSNDKSTQSNTVGNDTGDDTISESDYATEEEETSKGEGYILPAQFIKAKYRTNNSTKRKAPGASSDTRNTNKIANGGQSSGERNPDIPMKKTFKITNSNSNRLTFKNKTPLAAATSTPKISKVQPPKPQENDYDTISDYETETESDRSDIESNNFSEQYTGANNVSSMLSPGGLKTPKAIRGTFTPGSASASDLINTIKLSKQQFFKLTPSRELDKTPIKFSSFTPLVQKLVTAANQTSKQYHQDSIDSNKQQSTDSEEEYPNYADNTSSSPLVNRMRTKNRSKGTKKAKKVVPDTPSRSSKTPNRKISNNTEFISPGRKDNPFIEFGSPLNGYKFVGRKSSLNFTNDHYRASSSRTVEADIDPYKLSYDVNNDLFKNGQNDAAKVGDPIAAKYKLAVKAEGTSSPHQTYESYTKSWSQIVLVKKVCWPNKQNLFALVTHSNVKEFLKGGSEFILANEFKDKLLADKDYQDILSRIYKNVLKNERIRWHPDKMIRILTNVGILTPNTEAGDKKEAVEEPEEAKLEKPESAKDQGKGQDSEATKGGDQYANYGPNDRLLIGQITSTFQIINHVYESFSASL